MPFGGVVGSAFSGWIADGIGRRRGLIMSNIFIICSLLFIISSKPIMSYECLIAGRFFAGVSSGLSCSLLSLYLMEISPDNLRGSVGSINELASNIFSISNFKHLIKKVKKD